MPPSPFSFLIPRYTPAAPDRLQYHGRSRRAPVADRRATLLDCGNTCLYGRCPANHRATHNAVSHQPTHQPRRMSGGIWACSSPAAGYTTPFTLPSRTSCSSGNPGSAAEHAHAVQVACCIQCLCGPRQRARWLGSRLCHITARVVHSQNDATLTVHWLFALILALPCSTFQVDGKRVHSIYTLTMPQTGCLGAGARRTMGCPTRSRCRTSRPSSAASRLEMFSSACTLAVGDTSKLA